MNYPGHGGAGAAVVFLASLGLLFAFALFMSWLF